MPATAARPLELAEIPLLHARNPDPRTRALLWLGLCTGMRVGELVRLRVKHVLSPTGQILPALDLDTAVILKRGRGRSVPVNPILRLALQHWCLALGDLRPTCWLFPSRQGQGHPITRRTAMRLICGAFERAGLAGALTSHALRKTFATQMHKALGNDLSKTQIALAHASPASTVAYLASCNAEVAHAVRTLYLDTIPPELPFSA